MCDGGWGLKASSSGVHQTNASRLLSREPFFKIIFARRTRASRHASTADFRPVHANVSPRQGVHRFDDGV